MANTSRARPGYVYGVAIRTSGQEEGTPSCACACHVADTPTGAKGWYCNRCYAYIMCVRWPEPETRIDYTHEQAIADGKTNPRPYMVGVVAYYFITKGNSLDDAFPRSHFKTKEAAEARANELNDADALVSLKVPRTHRERFDRYRELEGARLRWRWSMYGDAHPLTQLPREPGRYAVNEFYDDGSDWTTYETMAEVEESVLTGDVSRIVDLDTGEDVAFALTAHFGQEAVAMRGP